MSAYSSVPPEVVAALAKENQSPLIIGIVSSFTALAFVFVCLRFISRVKFVRLVGMEDYFIALSMTFSILSSVCLVQQARYGNGRHLINIPYQNVAHLLRYLFFSIIAYHLSLMSTKLSILLQYRRIFTLKESRVPIYIVMGLCVATGITAVFCAIFTCIPIDAYWNLPKKAFAKCINQDAMYHANAGLNIATDILVAALPVRSLWTLQIPKKQKIVLLLVFTLGWFVCIISIIRLYFLVLVAKHQDDQTWYSGPAAYWSAMEVNLAIVCASTPALKPLVVKLIPRFGTRSASKQSYDQSGRSNNLKGSGNTGRFIKLNGKPSQSSMGEDIILEQGVTALPPARDHSHQNNWKRIHITRDIEQQSVNDVRWSDDSQKDLYKTASRQARW